MPDPVPTQAPSSPSAPSLPGAPGTPSVPGAPQLSPPPPFPNPNAAIFGALNAAISAIPPPFQNIVKTAINGFYKVLAKPPLPLPLPDDQIDENNDTIKLFVIYLILAILLFIWCFIKAILNPIPIIGIFFPLCDDPNGKDKVQPIIDNIQSNIDAATAATPQQSPGTITVELKEPKRSEDVGTTFERYTANLPPPTVGNSDNVREQTNVNNNSSSNNEPNAPVEFYSEGIADADQLRRMFGLGPVSSNVSDVIIDKSNNK